MDPQIKSSEIDALKEKLAGDSLPQDLKDHALKQLERIALTVKYGGSLTQLDITAKYIDWIVNMPWDKKSEDVLDIARAKQILDSHHYGLQKLKTRILEYLSVLILQRKRPNALDFHAPTLFFVGLAGTGKTSLGASIAEALGRKYIRIPFGGLSSALDLRGQSKTALEAEPGMIIRGIRRAGVKNPVILLDELDRISPASKDAIMGVLLEILDPGQNAHFTDYFLDYPFDLSQVLFIATANNTQNVSTAVLDRLEVVEMPSYSDEDKIAIAKHYVLPRLISEAGLDATQLTIDEPLWPKLVRPLGFDPGMRSLERLVETIVRRAAYRIVQGKEQSCAVTEANVREFTG